MSFWTCFWDCFWYLILTGILSFFVGRLLPKKWFHWNRVPYRAYAWEKNGKVYDALHIHRWQNKMPDMSKIFPKWIPPKSLIGDYRQRLPLMIQETCVAECIHVLLCVSGLYCLWLWPGIGGVVVWLLYSLAFNLPYILIQRYNRPRLVQLEQRMHKHRDSSQSKATAVTACAGTV